MAHNSVSRQIQKFRAKQTLLIMQSYISKHGQNKIQFVSHLNTSLVSPFTLLLFIGYCWNWFVVRKTCLPVSLQRNRKSKTEDLIVSCKRETFTLEFTINEKAKNKMLEYFACFTAHYTTTATSREVPDRETGNFLIFSLAGGGRSSRPGDKGGNGIKKFFGHNKMALRASLWSKITGSATVLYLSRHES